MKHGPNLPGAEKRLRLLATDPGRDAWVSANAGSGKTTILRNRVIRLLLGGVLPQRILCLTFTKAAAAEMQGRIFAELARWSGLDDAGLAKEIASLTGAVSGAAPPSREALAHARTLFARAIETPGGLRIQTIHAFAERVLHLFPLEADVPIDFTVITDAERAELLRIARGELVAKALAEPASALGLAFETILDATSPHGFEKSLNIAIGHLSDLAIGGRALAQGEAREALFRDALGLGPGDDLAKIEADFLAAMPDRGWFLHAAERLLDRKSPPKTVVANAAELMRIASLPPGEELCSAAVAFFLKKDGLPRQSVFLKPTTDAEPALADMEKAIGAACQAFRQRRMAVIALQRSLAISRFAELVLERYNAAKRARSGLDFGDQIAALRRLLVAGHANWVMMKLDAAIDHVLVDEAQDTTPEMWEIIRGLTDEFFAGKTRVERTRSLFVVGDEKQSIFSFQGADPDAFEASRRHFAARVLPRDDDVNLVRDPVPLNSSFRSSADILAGVDAVFTLDGQIEGLSAGGVPAMHSAAWGQFPGRLELWPPMRISTETAGSLAAANAQALRRHADHIAEKIAGWFARGARHLSDGRLIRPGDIIILVQKRGPLFTAILRALKLRRIPVAGADRLRLQDEIAVRDLIVIAEAALLPADDLALATTLKTPLYGYDDAALERLARGRAGSLREALRLSERREDRLASVHLDALGDAALRESPFGFFAALLNDPAPATPGRSGRHAMLVRLGEDAADPIDAFLCEAMAFPRNAPGSVLLFIDALRRGESVIKRDLEHGGDQVRVMTVHGAKGLEAPIVFLADAAQGPGGKKEDDVLLLRLGPEEALLGWAGSQSHEPETIRATRAAARRRATHEYRRLLYVGMTRAAERLYVTGHGTAYTKKEIEAGALREPDEPIDRSWHQLVAAGWKALAMSTLPPQPDDPALGGPRRRFLSEVPPAPPQGEARVAPTETVLPAWLRVPAPASAMPAPPIRPSQRAFPRFEPPKLPGAEAPLVSRLRGIALHRLYEVLPRLPEEARRRAGLAALARLAPELPEAEAAGWVDQAVSLLETGEGRRLFGPASRAEVAVAGHVTLPDGTRRAVSARIDRLVVEPARIEILDIKTGFPRHAASDAGILRQMALYRALMRGLYQDRACLCRILWAASGESELLPDDALDHVFNRLTSE